MMTLILLVLLNDIRVRVREEKKPISTNSNTDNRYDTDRLTYNVSNTEHGTLQTHKKRNSNKMKYN